MNVTATVGYDDPYVTRLDGQPAQVRLIVLFFRDKVEDRYENPFLCNPYMDPNIIFLTLELKKN